MSEPGYLIAISECFVHGGKFAFDPDRVVSVLIDPDTGLSPDLGGDPNKARKEPICPQCCKKANIIRRQRGLELLDETDTARE